MDTPDKGITGTSDKTDCAEIYGLAQEIIPDLEQKTLGILFCSGEKNSQVTVKELTDYLDSRNIRYKIKTIMNSSEAQQATLSLAKDCGAIFVPMDSVVQSAMGQVSSAALDHGVPILGSDPVMVRSGGTSSPQGEEIGRAHV